MAVSARRTLNSPTTTKDKLGVAENKQSTMRPETPSVDHLQPAIMPHLPNPRIETGLTNRSVGIISASGTRPRSPHVRGSLITPYAIRALQQRRAAARTPERSRRRSERQHRETPRGTLRSLSKILSKTTNARSSSPEQRFSPRVRSPSCDSDQIEIGEDKTWPRLSMPIAELQEDENSSRARPASLSVMSVGYAHTKFSIEAPRRAFSEQPLRRLSGPSAASSHLGDFLDEVSELDATRFDDCHFGTVNGFEQTHKELDRGTQEVTNLNGRTDDIRRLTTSDWTENTGSQTPPIGEVTTIILDIPTDLSGDGQLLAQNESHWAQGREKPETEESLFVKLPVARSTTVFKRSEKPRARKSSVHGVLPPLPVSVVKKLVVSCARPCGGQRTKINGEILGAIMQASAWFMEQVGDDLGTYAVHAGRRTINESDIIMLMKR
ncbi:hypothetical protein MMC13_008483 [Lambiella insularis]|nr:hypothetical protein [Lambiella insularis]